MAGRSHSSLCIAACPSFSPAPTSGVSSFREAASRVALLTCRWLEAQRSSSGVARVGSCARRTKHSPVWEAKRWGLFAPRMCCSEFFCFQLSKLSSRRSPLEWRPRVRCQQQRTRFLQICRRVLSRRVDPRPRLLRLVGGQSSRTPAGPPARPSVRASSVWLGWFRRSSLRANLPKDATNAGDSLPGKVVKTVLC